MRAARLRVTAAAALAVAGLVGVVSAGQTHEATAATPPTIDAPLGLPFAAGEHATLSAGPHENASHICPRGGSCNALDFIPSSARITAAADGVVATVPTACDPASPHAGVGRVGLVVINHQNGWYSGYYHLQRIQVRPGDHVHAGQWIGDLAQSAQPWPAAQQIYHGIVRSDATPCGGSWPGPHVHFFVKYTTAALGDPFQHSAPDVDLENLVIGGWRITKTAPTEGCMTYIATGEKQCSPNGTVKNYAAGASVSTSPPVRGGHYRGHAVPGNGLVTLTVTPNGANFAVGYIGIDLLGQAGRGSCVGPAHVTITRTAVRQITTAGTFDLTGTFAFTEPSTDPQAFKGTAQSRIKGTFSSHGTGVTGTVTMTVTRPGLSCHSGLVFFTARLA